MATEIAFSATVETGEGAKSLRSLKQEFKETQKELDGLTVGSEKYIQTLQKLGGIKDEIGDLNAEINSFNPEGKIQAFSNVLGGVASGFQAVTGAAALFGTENKDLEKTLVKLQAVMAFSEGIKGVTSLADGFSVLASNLKTTAIGTKIVTAAQWLWNAALDANPIGLIVAGLVALVAGLKAYAAASDDAIAKQERLNQLQKENAERTEMAIDAIKKRLQTNIDASQREIDLLKAQGASAEEIYKKEQSLTEQKRQLLNYINGYRGKLNDEERKDLLDLDNEKRIRDAAYTKSLEDNEKKISEQKKAEAEKRRKESQDNQKKQEQDQKEAAEKLAQLIKKQQDDIFKATQDTDADARATALKWLEDYNTNILAGAELRAMQNKNDLDAQLAYLEAQKENELLNTELTENERLVISEKYKQQELELTKQYKLKETQESFEIAKQGTQALQGLSDLYFNIKMANVKKGSKEEEAAARKQFKVNKALQLTGAIIDGAKAITSSLAQAPLAIGPVPNPVGIASLAAAIASTAASIAKIAGTQFESSNSGGNNIPSIGGGGGGVSANAPTLNAPNTGSTMLNPDGTIANNNTNPQQPIQAYVVETQLTQVQSNVSYLTSYSVL